MYMKNHNEDKTILQRNEECLFGDPQVQEEKGQKKKNKDKRMKKVGRERG
jgi:hypothetical protein